MILSTSTNLYCERPDGRICSLEETMETIHRVGFNVLDMSFYEYSYEGGAFLQNDWEAWIHSAAETATKNNIQFIQSHGYTYRFLNPVYEKNQEKKEYEELLVKRSLQCCHILGVKTVVLHPDMDITAEKPLENAWEMNRTYFQEYLEYADKLGMRLAIENMTQYSGKTENIFFSNGNEIAEFIDSFHDDRIGVCWDFEHGEIRKQNQIEELAAIGKRLYATHVSDTASDNYEPFMHILPFSGETHWKEIIMQLKHIDYTGCFSFEAHNFAKKLPDGLIDEALRYAYKVGKYLVESGEKNV